MNTADRQRLHETMTILVDHEPQVNYPRGDVRGPLDAATYALSGIQMQKRLASGGHLMMDCSQGIACVYKWSGMKNPSGKYAVGWPGTTGTLLQALPHYSDPSRARIGAIVIYGGGTGEHGSMVYEPGDDPLLWSHGFDGGPELIRLSVQRAHHHSPVTFLNVSGIRRHPPGL